MRWNSSEASPVSKYCTGCPDRVVVRGVGSCTEAKVCSDEGEGGGGMRLEEVSINANSVLWYGITNSPSILCIRLFALPFSRRVRRNHVCKQSNRSNEHTSRSRSERTKRVAYPRLKDSWAHSKKAWHFGRQSVYCGDTCGLLRSRIRRQAGQDHTPHSLPALNR